MRKTDPERVRTRTSATADLRLAQNEAQSVEAKCTELHAATIMLLGEHATGSRLEAAASNAVQTAAVLADLLRVASEAASRMDVTIEVPDPDGDDEWNGTRAW